MAPFLVTLPNLANPSKRRKSVLAGQPNYGFFAIGLGHIMMKPTALLVEMARTGQIAGQGL